MILFSAVLSLVLAGLPASAGVDSKRQELNKVQEELGETKREIEAYKKQEESLNQEMRQLKTHGQQAGQKMEELRARIRTAERKRSELQARTASLKAVSGSWRAQASSEIRRYAMRASLQSEVFGTKEIWEQALTRRALLDKAGMLIQLQGASRKTQLAVEETRRRASELQSKSEKALAEKRATEVQYEAKQEAYAQTQEKTAAAVKRAKELEDSAKALTSLINQFLRAAKAHHAGKAVLDIPKHSLDWPAEGTVTASFGKEKNPDLGTWVIHSGIRLATAAGARVCAVESGKVIFAGPFKSYGQVVILDHGSGFYSIYGELGEILSVKGRQVAGGDVIAGAGKAAAGGVLYLELRRGSEALDPLQWLRKK